MESQDRVGISYLYLANKKNYLLGVRVNRVKTVLIGFFVAFLIGKMPLLLTSIIGWLIIGWWLDTKQRGQSKNYIESQRAWMKTKGMKICDEPGGVLKVFRKKQDE